MDSVAVKPLTVGFQETQFLDKLNRENQAGFWFQFSDEARQQVGSPWGPANPQALNRYSYVQNNPLKYTDPTGLDGSSPGKDGKEPSKSNPFKGTPGSSSTTYQRDGSPKQTRYYGKG